MSIVQDSAQRETQTKLCFDGLADAVAGPPTSEIVTTTMHFPVPPERTWDAKMFYEEIPGRPSWLLRTFMPCPVHTDGAKARPGDEVHCTYTTGDLVKRMTVVDPPHLVRFDVLDQRLGIERCAVAQRGSYEIEPNGDGSDVILTTHYLGYLHPRWLWRPLERQITHQLHRHVLRGMRDAAIASVPARIAPQAL